MVRSSCKAPQASRLSNGQTILTWIIIDTPSIPLGRGVCSARATPSRALPGPVVVRRWTNKGGLRVKRKSAGGRSRTDTRLPSRNFEYCSQALESRPENACRAIDREVT
jgi:hypothetical protein